MGFCDDTAIPIPIAGSYHTDTNLNVRLQADSDIVISSLSDTNTFYRLYHYILIIA